MPTQKKTVAASQAVEKLREFLDAEIDSLAKEADEAGNRIFANAEEVEREEWWALRQTFVRRRAMTEVRAKLDELLASG